MRPRILNWGRLQFESHHLTRKFANCDCTLSSAFVRAASTAFCSFGRFFAAAAAAEMRRFRTSAKKIERSRSTAARPSSPVDYADGVWVKESLNRTGRRHKRWVAHRTVWAWAGAELRWASHPHHAIIRDQASDSSPFDQIVTNQESRT
jgi:hypothetical protein